jgi:hypothetical protein
MRSNRSADDKKNKEEKKIKALTATPVVHSPRISRNKPAKAEPEEVVSEEEDDDDDVSDEGEEAGTSEEEDNDGEEDEENEGKEETSSKKRKIRLSLDEVIICGFSNLIALV